MALNGLICAEMLLNSHHSRCSVSRSCSQGDHSPGKPGKVRELDIGQGKVRENGKSQGKL